MSPYRLAIQLMVAQGILFAGETAALHQIGGHASVMQLACIRAGGGVILAFVLARNLGFRVMRTQQLPLQLLRGVVSLLYLWVLIYSFAHMSFADATAISYTQTAYIAVFSVLILGEAVTAGQWAGAAVGIVGALLIAKPAFAGWNSAYLIALFGTSLNGLAFVLNRYLQREDGEATTLFYTNLVPLLGNAPAFLLGAMPGADTLLWLPGVFLLGPLGMFAGIVAVRYANASALGPYTLVRLVIAMIGGVAIFRELPDVFSLSGAVLILLSCVISSAPFIARLQSVLRLRDVPATTLAR
ncbi:MAG TPA: DMT family transporter [Stellaceae bacterium]|nr:DMT family transporter [Stellaceae bacterium]